MRASIFSQTATIATFSDFFFKWFSNWKVGECFYEKEYYLLLVFMNKEKQLKANSVVIETFMVMDASINIARFSYTIMESCLHIFWLF